MCEGWTRVGEGQRLRIQVERWFRKWVKMMRGWQTARDEASEKGKLLVLRESIGLSSNSSWAIMPWSK